MTSAKAAAPARGQLRPPYQELPMEGGLFPVGCSSRSTPPSAGESNLAAFESFPDTFEPANPTRPPAFLEPYRGHPVSVGHAPGGITRRWRYRLAGAGIAVTVHSTIVLRTAPEILWLSKLNALSPSSQDCGGGEVRPHDWKSRGLHYADR